MIIVIEGADGCGKDTVAKAVAKELCARFKAFPDDDAVTGPAIRSYLKKQWGVESLSIDQDSNEKKLGALAFQALQVVNRIESLELLQLASKNECDLVLARYNQSATVYGGLDGLDQGWLRKVMAFSPVARLNVLLDAHPETCMARRAARDGDLPPERYEGKLGFTREVVSAYRRLWMYEMERDPRRWRVSDAEMTAEQVVDDVLELVTTARAEDDAAAGYGDRPYVRPPSDQDDIA